MSRTRSSSRRLTQAVAEFVATFIQDQSTVFAGMSEMDGWGESVEILVEHGTMLHQAACADPVDDWYGAMEAAATWLAHSTIAGSTTTADAQREYTSICKANA